MSGTPPEETITPDALLRRLRAVAEERIHAGAPEPPPQALYPSERVEAWEPFPWRTTDGRPAAPSAFVSVLDFVDLEPRRFVRFCFQALLGRHPTEREAVRWVGRVARGWPRLLPVLALRWSREGRSRAVRLDGVRARVSLDLDHLSGGRLRRWLRRE
jgi:hypothetical protein